jgi:hypothetical protein
MFPKEDALLLIKPPFRSIKYGHSREYLDSFNGDPEKIFIIGDFGIGSDASIGLDYNHIEPKVMCSEWVVHPLENPLGFRRDKNHVRWYNPLGFKRDQVRWWQCAKSPEEFAHFVRTNAHN